VREPWEADEVNLARSEACVGDSADVHDLDAAAAWVVTAPAGVGGVREEAHLALHGDLRIVLKAGDTRVGRHAVR
jgi:hypothetical protein